MEKRIRILGALCVILGLPCLVAGVVTFGTSPGLLLLPIGIGFAALGASWIALSLAGPLR